MYILSFPAGRPVPWGANIAYACLTRDHTLDNPQELEERRGMHCTCGEVTKILNKGLKKKS